MAKLATYLASLAIYLATVRPQQVQYYSMVILSVAGIGVAEALTAHLLAGFLGYVGQEHDKWPAGRMRRKG